MSIDWPTFFLCTDAKFGDKMDFILVNIPAKRVIICTHRYAFLFAKNYLSKGKQRRNSRGESKQFTKKREVKESEREE